VENLFSALERNDKDLERLRGILPSQVLRRFVDSGKIIAPSYPITVNQIQPASIDLRLGRKAFQVEASFLPGKFMAEKKIRDWFKREVSLDEPTVFRPGEVYVVPLIESLALPPNVRGKANPKSTTGRLDIFTRLITDGGLEFESVPEAYHGNLYLEIVSRTFRVAVRAGMKLTQLRLIQGKPIDVSDEMLSKLAKTEQLVHMDDENPVEAKILGGLRMSVDLQGNGSKVIAYRAKSESPVIDLGNINHYEVKDFWDAMEGPQPRGIILDKGAFYILASAEKVSVPPTYAGEMVPYDPSIGEFRVHYAGFFDPGFGYGVNGIKGTKAVLEVRSHEVPIVLEDRQEVGRLVYHKMAEEPDRLYGPSIGSSYQQQGLTLSKHFKRPSYIDRESILSLNPTLEHKELTHESTLI
jgi:dCTP deaminase